MTADSAERLREIAAFLDGSGELDGRSFSDDGPIISGIRRNYWWRKPMRESVDALLAEARKLRGEVDRFKSKWMGAENSLALCEAALHDAEAQVEAMRSALLNLMAGAPSAKVLRDLSRDDGVLNRPYQLTVSDGALLDAHAALLAGASGGGGG